MKIVISQPMKGLAEEQIRSNRAAVAAVLKAQGHEILDSIFPGFDESKVKYAPLYYLAKSLALIAEQADAVYFMDGWQGARSCSLEHEAYVQYGVRIMNE